MALVLMFALVLGQAALLLSAWVVAIRHFAFGPIYDGGLVLAALIVITGLTPWLWKTARAVFRDNSMKLADDVEGEIIFTPADGPRPGLLPSEAILVRDVRRLADKAGLYAPPAVGIIEGEDFEACVHGRWRGGDTLYVSRAALHVLLGDDLTGLVAHEIAHVARRDRLSTELLIAASEGVLAAPRFMARLVRWWLSLGLVAVILGLVIGLDIVDQADAVELAGAAAFYAALLAAPWLVSTLYWLVGVGVLRHLEFEADRLAVHLTSRDVVLGSLKAIAAAFPDAEDKEPSWLDPHPTLRELIDHLEAMPPTDE